MTPEFEVWHAGSVWNLNYLIEWDLLQPPYVCTLFFGWPGRHLVAADGARSTSIAASSCRMAAYATSASWATDQRDIIAAAIAAGDHVRVGTEDYPFDQSGRLVHTHELVREIASIARSLGRPVASVEEARRILGLDRS